MAKNVPQRQRHFQTSRWLRLRTWRHPLSRFLAAAGEGNPGRKGSRISNFEGLLAMVPSPIVGTSTTWFRWPAGRKFIATPRSSLDFPRHWDPLWVTSTRHGRNYSPCPLSYEAALYYAWRMSRRWTVDNLSLYPCDKISKTRQNASIS